MLVFRKLLAHEAGRLADHLLRLDEEDRRLRFGHFVTSEAIRAYADTIDWTHIWVVGVFAEGVLRGVAELRPSGGPPAATAELSVTVEGPWQDHGVGTRLMEAALLIARNRGFETVYLLCLPDNLKMQHVARKFGDRTSIHDGDIEMRIESPCPDALSILSEMLGDAVTLWNTALGRLFGGPSGPHQPSVP